MLKLIKDKTVPSNKYCISDHGFLPYVVREDDELFHALVIPITFSKYILHQVHDALGHNGTARTYWCLKWSCYWKGLCKDIDVYTKQCIMCRK